MSARVVVVDPRSPDPAILAEAAAVLRAGGLVAFPTETVYGLGARALDPSAVARVYAAKGRPAHHPLIAHVDGEAMARRLAAEWSERASRLARAFWPGPLTLVVPRASDVPAAVAGGGDSIAVRAPANAIARALIATLGEPIAAPSANRFQEVSPTTAAHVVKSLGASTFGVDLVLDGGACDRGIESTVVDVRGDAAVVLRPGPLELSALRAVEPSVVFASVIARADDGRSSPGMDARHYAPRARLVIAGSWAEAQRAACDLAAAGARVGLVLHSERVPDLTSELAKSGRVVVRDLPRDAAGYARGFYAALHEMDDEGVDAIVIEDVPDDDAWWAVADRLRRSATSR
jgi:L-threonylcarbamoyladenylate synthase